MIGDLKSVISNSTSAPGRSSFSNPSVLSRGFAYLAGHSSNLQFRTALATAILIALVAAAFGSETRWMEVTYYCPCQVCCGRHACGLTATGRRAVGPIVAVDPRRVAMGSWVNVPGLGWHEASDTGRDIIGNRLDVLRPCHEEARRMGRRWLRVEIETQAAHRRRVEDGIFWARFDELRRIGRLLCQNQPGARPVNTSKP